LIARSISYSQGKARGRVARQEHHPDPGQVPPGGDGQAGVKLPAAGQYGVGMVFLPRDPASRFACEYEIERAIKDEGQTLLGWRDVRWITAISPSRPKTWSR